MSPFLANDGYCCCCDQRVRFVAEGEWLRDQYLCPSCQCVPRERALMHCIDKFFPQWRKLQIHESSPSHRGASPKLKRLAARYVGSQYYPTLKRGALHESGFLNQDLEDQTFDAASFDLVITQDVVEHLFNPAKAFAEIARTLRPGGAHIFTVPILNKERPTEVWAEKAPDGGVRFLKTPEYHGNPIDPQGSPVTMHWGYDIAEFILQTSGLVTTIIFIDNLDLGIRAEFNEVLVSRKLR